MNVVSSRRKLNNKVSNSGIVSVKLIYTVSNVVSLRGIIISTSGRTLYKAYLRASSSDLSTTKQSFRPDFITGSLSKKYSQTQFFLSLGNIKLLLTETLYCTFNVYLTLLFILFKIYKDYMIIDYMHIIFIVLYFS